MELLKMKKGPIQSRNGFPFLLFCAFLKVQSIFLCDHALPTELSSQRNVSHGMDKLKPEGTYFIGQLTPDKLGHFVNEN